MVRRVGVAIAALTASLAVGMTPVAADNREANDAGTLRGLVTMTVEADRVVSSESTADSCSVLVFYEFDDHPGIVEAALTYENTGDEKFAYSSPPFNDVVEDYPPVRTAPPGRHRILVNASGVSQTADPAQCDRDHGAWSRQAFSPTGSVVLTIEGEDPPQLTVELKTYSTEGGSADSSSFPPVVNVDPDDADETTVLGIFVRNEGDEPLDGVQVRGLSTKVIKSRCKGNPLTPGRAGPLGTPTTLQPGQERFEYYELKERCPGEVKATVRATATGAEEATADTRIVVPDSAYIVGQLTYGFLHPFEYERLAENLKIRAVGKEKTLTTTSIDENRRFSIKVPNRALGRYELTVTGNKLTEAVPARVFVTAVRGKSVEAKGFELGYDCDEAPLGLDFVPDGTYYRVAPAVTGRNARLELSYECRTQRIQLAGLDIYDEEPEPDDFEFDNCVSSDGSTYGAAIVDFHAGSRLPLDRGEFEFTVAINEELSPPATVRGVFTSPDGGTVTVSHPECDFLNFEADFYASD